MKHMTVSGIMLIAIASALLSLYGCTIRSRECLVFEVDPRPLPGFCIDPDCEPRELEPVVFRGREFRPIDADCDGRPDLVRDTRNGRHYRVTPVASTGGNLQTHPDKTDPGYDFEDPSTHLNGDYAIELHTPFPNTRDFEFGGATAAEWTQRYGVDVRPGAPAAITAIELLFDTETTQTELLLPYSMSFELPSPDAHGVMFEALGLLDGSGPGFLVLRIGGTARNVIGYLAALSANGGFTFEFVDETGDAWFADADADTGIVTLYYNGEVLLQEPLG